MMEFVCPVPGLLLLLPSILQSKWSLVACNMGFIYADFVFSAFGKGMLSCGMRVLPTF